MGGGVPRTRAFQATNRHLPPARASAGLASSRPALAIGVLSPRLLLPGSLRAHVKEGAAQRETLRIGPVPGEGWRHGHFEVEVQQEWQVSGASLGPQVEARTGHVLPRSTATATGQATWISGCGFPACWTWASPVPPPTGAVCGRKRWDEPLLFRGARRLACEGGQLPHAR